MDDTGPKENVPLIVQPRDQDKMIPVEPSKPHAPQEIVLANEAAEPRASIETICSLDISDNIPRIVPSMDAEDSPWGGR